MDSKQWPYKLVDRSLWRGYRDGNFRGGKPDTLRGPEKTSLVSSAHGRIEQLCFFIPNYALDDDDLYDGFKNVISEFPEPTKFVVVFNSNIKDKVTQLIREASAEGRMIPIEFPGNIRMTMWAQDAYLVATDDTKMIRLLEPINFRRLADAFIAQKIKEQRSRAYYNRRTPIYFEGGNVLTADNFYLIGYDHIAQLSEYADTKLKAHDKRAHFGQYVESTRRMYPIGYKTNGPAPIPPAKNRYVTINGKKWLEVDNTNPSDFQPIFHIDMFLTLAGRKDGKYRILLGSPLCASKLLGQNELHPFARHQIYEELRTDLENQISGEDIEIICNPLPLVSAKLTLQEAQKYWPNIDPLAGGAIVYYFASYNNCLVEIPNHCKEVCDHLGKPTVWLPTYGYGNWPDLAKTDDEMVAIWEGLGFEVKKIGNFHPFAFQGGAVHCLAQYFKRKDIEESEETEGRNKKTKSKKNLRQKKKRG
jgi:hypothetical protein